MLEPSHIHLAPFTVLQKKLIPPLFGVGLGRSLKANFCLVLIVPMKLELLAAKKNIHLLQARCRRIITVMACIHQAEILCLGLVILLSMLAQIRDGHHKRDTMVALLLITTCRPIRWFICGFAKLSGGGAIS